MWQSVILSIPDQGDSWLGYYASVPRIWPVSRPIPETVSDSPRQTTVATAGASFVSILPEDGIPFLVSVGRNGDAGRKPDNGRSHRSRVPCGWRPIGEFHHGSLW